MNRRPFLKFPVTALMAIVLTYVVFTLLAMGSAWTWDWASVRNDSWGTRFFLLGFGCAVAGALRIAIFHPRFAVKYAAWLSFTPWRPGMHLPLGPVELVWEDLILVVPLGFLAVVDAGVPAWVPIASYLLGFSALAVASVRSRLTVWLCFALILIGSLPVLWRDQIAVLWAVLLIAIVIAHAALSVSLQHFPWDLGDSMREFKLRPRAGLAWPLDRAGPAVLRKPIPPAVGWAAAALCGWWTFVLLTFIPADDLGGFGSFIVVGQIPILCAVFSLYRVMVYRLTHWAPISLRGRLMTGQFIIPGFDYVYIAPLLMGVTGFVLPRVLATHVPLPIVGGLTVACVAALGLNAGPTLRHWQLTGHHRMFPGGRREPAVPKGRAARRFGL